MSHNAKPLRPEWNAVPQEQFRSDLRKLTSVADLAGFLKLSPTQVSYYAYKVAKTSAYTTFRIPRRNGRERTIEAPTRTLKYIQRILHETLVKVYGPHPAVHGFREGRSIVTNAREHLGSKFLLNIDLEDFFYSITRKRVFGRLTAAPYYLNPRVANAIASLTTNAYSRLPQGSPTSPVVANIVAAGLDDELAKLSGTLACWYTRYADDISISTTRNQFPPGLARYPNARGTGQVVLGDALVDLVERHDFKVNESKTRLQSYWTRQSCTGLVVNGPRLTPPRRYIRRLRSLVHHWQRNGWADAARVLHEKENRVLFSSREELTSHVIGRLSYLKMVRGPADIVCKHFQNVVDSIPVGH